MFILSLIILLVSLPLLHILFEQKNKYLLKLIDFLLWLKDDVVTKDGFQCLTCDKKNRDGLVILICIILIPLIGIIFLIVNFFYNISIPSVIYLILTILFFVIFINFLTEWRIFPTILSYQKAIQCPQSDNLSDYEDHVAIILPHYTIPKENFFIGDCITLLIEGFQKSNKKYRIYNVFNLKDFTMAYENDNVSEMWILGHGDHGGLCWGNKIDDYIKYSTLKKLEHPKKFIVQLHCNNGDDESLQEINQCKGFVSKHMRMSFQNRCYIINTLKKVINDQLSPISTSDFSEFF
jgi:hypothetical protein